MASTAIRREIPEGVAIGDSKFQLSLYAQHLAAPINARFRIYAMRPKQRAVRGVGGELGSLKGVGSAAVGAAPLGLFAFRIGHG